MNNFPAMTEEQRAEIIKLCTSAINETPDDDEVVMHLIAQVALAALTNDGQALARKVWSDLDRMASPEPFMRAAYESVMRNYTAPPAPVLKPIELPKKYVCDKNGCDDDLLPSWQVMISCDEIIAAIRAAGYEVKS